MTSWQDVRDMGLGLFKKQNRSRTLWMGGSSTFLGILAYIILLAGVSVTTSGDIVCGEECVSYVNITSTYWRICFEDEFELVKTDPQGVDIDVYVPTYGSRWRLFDVTKDCIERKSKYNSLPNRFKIVGHKPKSLTVKWWSDAMHIPDPVWEGVFDTNVVIDLGNNQTDLSFAINYSKVDWSSIINITSGNWTWNMSEDDVVSYNTGAFTFNITNNDTTAPHNILMKIDRDANYYSLYCNNTYINVGWTKILTNLSSNGSVQINCTMDFNNISKRIVNFYDPIYLDNLTAYWRFGQSLSNETIDYIGSNNGVNNGYTFNNARLNDNTVRNETYGKYGKGFGFDGDGDYILVVNKTNQIFNITTGSRSYSSWIKPRGGPKNSVLITTASANNQGDYMSIRSNVGSQFNCVFLDGTNQHYKAYPIDLSWNDDTWYHLYCGYDGTTVVMCVNGICDSGEDGSSARTYNYRGLFIGTESDMDNQLNGSLDNICIINHSLTQTEVTALYSSGMYPNASTPCDVLYLSGETGNTTDAYDENNLVDGEWEQANRFDGVNDYINTNLVPNGNEITISTWFQTNELGATQGLISLYDDSSNGIYTRFDSGNVLRAGIYDSGAGYTVVGSISVIDTNWHHFALTFNNISKNVIMYVDGVVDQNLTSSNAVKYSTTGMAIGRYKNDVAGAELNGSIDDVMIFNRSLTSAEINSLYYGYDRTQHNYNYEFKGE